MRIAVLTQLGFATAHFHVLSWGYLHSVHCQSSMGIFSAQQCSAFCRLVLLPGNVKLCLLYFLRSFVRDTQLLATMSLGQVCYSSLRNTSVSIAYVAVVSLTDRANSACSETPAVLLCSASAKQKKWTDGQLIQRSMRQGH